MLTLRGVTAGYGRTTVLRNVDLTVDDGEVVALLGPNGAGKTTLMRVASGFLKPKAGHVELDGTSMDSIGAYAFARRGVCHLPEGRGIFPTLTVYENLRIQCGPKFSANMLDSVLQLFPELRTRMRQTAGSLSGGEQQMLALARAYVTNPRVVLVDEASMGLAPLVVDRIYQVLHELADRGLSILIVEQYVHRALDLARSVYILRRGEIVHEGSSAEVDVDEIYRRYLGTAS